MRKCPRSCPYFAPAFQRRSKAVRRQSWRAVSSACLHDVRYSLNVHCRRHGGGHAGRISGSIAEGGCHHVRQGNRNFSGAAIKLGEAITALNAVQAQIRAEAREIQALAVADQQPNNATRSKYRSNAAYAGELAYWAAQRILIWQALAPFMPAAKSSNFPGIIVATRHVTQSVHINTAEHGRARINLPLTNPSLSSTALSQH